MYGSDVFFPFCWRSGWIIWLMNRHHLSLRGGHTCFVMVFHSILRQYSNYRFCALSSRDRSVCAIFFAIPNYGKPLLAKVLPSEIVDFSYCLLASIGLCMDPMEMDKGSILKHFILKSGNFGGVVYIEDKWDSSLMRLLLLWYVGQMGS